MRKSPIRPQSRKRAALNRRRAKDRKALIGLPCEAQLAGCAYTGTDWHERLSRARGGSIVDPDNRAWLCRPCHEYITTHPRWAESAGWSLSRWEK